MTGNTIPHPAPRASRRILWAIIGVAMLLGAARLWRDHPALTDDQTSTWWPVSLSVADGEGFVECLPQYFPFCGPGNDATAMREPAPIYFFAAVASIARSLWLAAIVQLLLQALVILMIHRLVREVASERAALIAAAMWTVYLPGLIVVQEIAGDVLATLTVTLGLWLYLRAMRSGKLSQWIVAGICMGIASLSRSALLVTSIPLALAILWRMRGAHYTIAARVRPLVVFALAWSITMAPWVVRNQMVFHQPVIGSTLSGYNLLRHNHQITGNEPFHYVIGEEALPIIQAALAAHPELTGHENEAQVDRIYKAEGMAVIKAHKARYVELCAYRFLPLWFNWGVYAALRNKVGTLDYLMAAQQAVLLLLALLGLRYAPRRALPLAFCVVFLSLVYMAVVARMRYLVPVMPIVMLYGAIAIDRFLSRRAESR